MQDVLKFFVLLFDLWQVASLLHSVIYVIRLSHMHHFLFEAV